jgi:hypothetical protein
MIVFLWDAVPACGVTGSLATAQLRAGDMLLDGKARCALVQAARLALGTDLEPSYERIGSAWRANRYNGGSIHWKTSAS